MFGFLEYSEPFRTMFDVQINESGLPRLSMPVGKAGEMAIGFGLLLPACFRRKIANLYHPTVFVASAGLVVNMGVATYVHLQPKVPASVLPLGIKTPFIPLFVMFLAVVNLYHAYRGNSQRLRGIRPSHRVELNALARTRKRPRAAGDEARPTSNCHQFGQSQWTNKPSGIGTNLLGSDKAVDIGIDLSYE